MKKIAPKEQLVKGLDVSSYQGTINFKDVKLSGRDFVIAKCDEYNADGQYARNKREALSAGLTFGAYHFFHPSINAMTQAKNFIQRAQLGKGNLVPMLDWETTDGLPTMNDIHAAKVFLDELEQYYGRTPIIYSYPYFLDAMKLTADWARYPLWIANFAASAPLVPSPWTDFAFWQLSDSGHIQGIPSPKVDLDVFNGTYTELQKLVL